MSRQPWGHDHSEKILPRVVQKYPFKDKYSPLIHVLLDLLISLNRKIAISEWQLKTSPDEDSLSLDGFGFGCLQHQMPLASPSSFKIPGRRQVCRAFPRVISKIDIIECQKLSSFKHLHPNYFLPWCVAPLGKGSEGAKFEGANYRPGGKSVP